MNTNDELITEELVLETIEEEIDNTTASEALEVSHNFSELSLMRKAKVAIESKLLPSWINTPEKAIIALKYASELKLPDLNGLSLLYIVNGTPTLTALGMKAMIFKNGGRIITVKDFEKTKFQDRETFVTELACFRPKDPLEYRVNFYWAEAIAMELTKKANWVKMPRAMMMARAISKAARDVFPDFLCGIGYTPDEIGAEVTYDDSLNMTFIRENGN